VRERRDKERGAKRERGEGGGRKKISFLSLFLKSVSSSNYWLSQNRRIDLKNRRIK
jgi:hypothetical protein